ncbi:hypothetical protein HDU91_003834, partial [Kappamyces sp. JEL0680]
LSLAARRSPAPPVSPGDTWILRVASSQCNHHQPGPRRLRSLVSVLERGPRLSVLERDRHRARLQIPRPGQPADGAVRGGSALFERQSRALQLDRVRASVPLDNHCL